MAKDKNREREREMQRFEMQAVQFPIFYCNLCSDHIVNSLAFANANSLNLCRNQLELKMFIHICVI